MSITLGRIGELELRFNDELNVHVVESLEIVHWVEHSDDDHEDGISDATIAQWRYDGLYSSPDLVFVGQRPFQPSVDRDAFWNLAEQGNLIANSIWELEIEALRARLDIDPVYDDLNEETEVGKKKIDERK